MFDTDVETPRLTSLPTRLPAQLHAVIHASSNRWPRTSCMPRAPFQVLVVSFRRVGDQVEFAVLRRKDMNVCQAVAGGGEAGESLEEAAAREVREELGLNGSVPLYPLLTTVGIPPRFCAERDSWPLGTYVVREHSFAADLTGMKIKISHEHRHPMAGLRGGPRGAPVRQ